MLADTCGEFTKVRAVELSALSMTVSNVLANHTIGMIVLSMCLSICLWHCALWLDDNQYIL